MPHSANITPFRQSRSTPEPLGSPQALGEALSNEEARRSFLRMVSHELRTPLNSIIGFSEILNQELCGPIGSLQYKEYAGLIHDSGHRLLKLVNQILDIVRLEGQAEEMDLGSEALEPLVDGAFRHLRAEAEAQDVRLCVEDPGGLPDVVADPRAMHTVLVNLLQNAIAFSPRGGKVTVRARLIAGAVVIEIEDQGPGVAPSDLDRILRPFEQGEQALTRHAEGAGLGLPIVRLLCEAMDGALQLRCAPGEGLTAMVTLVAA